MSWMRLRKYTITWPLALLAVVLVATANEVGYMRSLQAMQELNKTQDTRVALEQLLQDMLNAETGQRGFLLTGQDRYLHPYTVAISRINARLQTLSQAYAAEDADYKDVAQLAQQVERRLSEMDITVKLRRQGSDEVWNFMLFTDVGQQDMDAIRLLTARMIDRSESRNHRHVENIEQSLALARVGIAIGALLSLLALYVFRRQAQALQAAHRREHQVLERERDRLEQLVRERTASLSELAHHLQQVREDERAHLARELHDELGALLTSAKLDLARLKSRIDLSVPDTAERIEHLTESLNGGIALKRRIIEDLRPSSLSNLGLTAALEILTREFSARSDIQVDTQLHSVQLTPAAQLTSYRLVQEALTNMAKHAHATQAWVSVTQQPSHVEVEVRDNGSGFDPECISQHSHGLLGMRYRVEAEGGHLSVASRPGQGTVVRAVLPQGPSVTPAA